MLYYTIKSTGAIFDQKRKQILLCHVFYFDQFITNKRVLDSFLNFYSNLKDTIFNYDRMIYIFTVFKKRSNMNTNKDNEIKSLKSKIKRIKADFFEKQLNVCLYLTIIFDLTQLL